MKFYRGAAAAARTYVEADRSRVDDYYLAEGTGLAERYIATPTPEGGTPAGHGERGGVRAAGALDGPAYERWVAGYDVETGQAKGRLRQDTQGLRFVEVVVNGPKTWSLVAALEPEIAAAFDRAQDRAAAEVIEWLAEHATTRVGPRGRQVQVPVEQVEAAVVRHYTSRAGDPHRHLHLQINARVLAAGGWRGLHSVGVVDSIEAINGIGHAAVMCDPEFRAVLAAHGYTLDTTTGEITQLTKYVGAFSARASQITRNIDSYEARWRSENPGREPDARLRRTWDRRAWAHARPDKVSPRSGSELRERWIEELHELGFAAPPSLAHPVPRLGTPIGRIDRDAVARIVLARLGARRSSWNVADIRGEVERTLASADIVAATSVRQELAEDLTSRTTERCAHLLTSDAVPEHVRALTSDRVLDVETELHRRLSARADQPVVSVPLGSVLDGHELDQGQRQVVAASVGAPLMVIEGAAGSGKTTMLTAVRDLVALHEWRLVVVTPTLRAAGVVEEQVGVDASSAAWLIHQHGFRWDDDGRWSRVPAQPTAQARLRPGDLLVVDEAGMLDQDTALALLTIADENRVRLAFLGDRHQLAAVGRGGVLDHAIRWAPSKAHFTLDTVHRFTDPEYAELTLLMRTGERAGEVFDALLAAGQITVHPTEVERLDTLTTLLTTEGGDRVIADTREQVRTLNAAVRDQRLTTVTTPATQTLTTALGECIGPGDQVSTRLNDRDLGVANRDRWTVVGIEDDGSVRVRGLAGERSLPPRYVHEHVELAYATTVHGAQGETVNRAHLLIGDTTGAAAAYVGMTRGRAQNTAHLVASTTEEARSQWIEVFTRDRADLGPQHAARTAAEMVDRYGPRAVHPIPARANGGARRPEHDRAPGPARRPGRGISR
ncbi:hypothetical protein GCM10027596_02660 [Nocardioides korecus]